MIGDAMSNGPARLMVLEDEGLVAEDIRSILTRAGFSVVFVTDRGDQALAAARTVRPDLVLCDIHVRGAMDGISVAEALRPLDIPVIFVTAFADASVLQRASNTEPYGYVVKPFNEADLIAAVTVALHRRHAEMRGRSMERWLATTLSSIGDAVIATDSSGRITFINVTAEVLTGWVRGSAIGRPLHEVFQVYREGEDHPIMDHVSRTLESGVVFHLTQDYELRTRHGTRIPIDDSIAPIRKDDGPIDGLVVVFRDRSGEKQAAEERARAQKRLQEAQRLESLGVLAGGIAHDFNNLLAVIVGNTNLAREEMPSDAPPQEYLAAVETAAHRAASLCAAMLAYAGKGRHKRTSLDLNGFLEETVNLLRVSTPSNVRLAGDFDDQVSMVIGDPAQLQQVFMNLLLNAIEAIGTAEGTVVIRTSRTTLSAQELDALLMPSPTPEHFVCVEVQDDGPGMTEDVQAHIFDPFFTTKVFGRGLGLSAVRGIIEQHNGAISVESRVGAGTTFRLLLPLPNVTPVAATDP